MASQRCAAWALVTVALIGVFAAGDVAYAATDDLGNFSAMSCQHAIADLLGIAPTPYRQPKYVTCLDLGTWGAAFTEGWDRPLTQVKQQAKTLDGFRNSGADFMPEYKPFIEDGKTLVASPHKLYGPPSNDLMLQLRKQRIDKIALAGMAANALADERTSKRRA